LNDESKGFQNASKDGYNERVMKKLFVVFALTVILSACTSPGGMEQNPPSLKPNPQPQTATLYRGDWGWAAVNANNTNDYVTGVVSFSGETTNNQSSSAQFGKKIATGSYDVTGIDSKPLGAAIMGPIASPVDAGFAIGDKLLMVAVDSDGAMGTTDKGKSVFSGPGRIFDSKGGYINVGVAFVQSTENPTYTAVADAHNLSVNSKLSGLINLQSLSTVEKASIALSERLAAEQRPSSGKGSLNDLLK
jgi:hypothetical protein